MDVQTLEDVFSNEYFKINKSLQELTGLWPYKSWTYNAIRRTIVLLALGAVTAPNVNGMRVWCGKSLGLCAENVSGVVYASGCFLKYLVTFTNGKNISKVYERVTETWLAIQDPEEKAIMIKYAKIGKLKSVGYVGMSVIILF